MNIGSRVRELRKNRGMTQGELAEAVEADQVYISRIENGRLKNVKPEVVKKLAVLFNVSIEYLLVGEQLEPWYRPDGEQRIQRFLKLFLMLSPANQALVMDFVDMLMRRSKWEPDDPRAKKDKGNKAMVGEEDGSD